MAGVLQAGAAGREDWRDGCVWIVGTQKGVEVRHEEALLVAGALPRLPLVGFP